MENIDRDKNESKSFFSQMLVVTDRPNLLNYVCKTADTRRCHGQSQ
jgi:hypothetical protein